MATSFALLEFDDREPSRAPLRSFTRTQTEHFLPRSDRLTPRGHYRRMRLVLGVVLLGVACGTTTNPACVEDDEESVDLDEDLGGYSIASLANRRSGRAQMIEPDGTSMGLAIETVPSGDAVRQAWLNCDGNLYAATHVQVSLHSDDHRIEVVLDGELSSELDGPGLLELPDVAFADLQGIFAVPMPEVATSTVTGVRFDLAGIDGKGTIAWTSTGPAPLLPIADLTLPYAVSEDDFGP